LKARGIAARKQEKQRLKSISELQILGPINPILWIPIRDPQKNPLPEELEATRSKYQALYDNLALE
jgi:hypothetical protein